MMPQQTTPAAQTLSRRSLLKRLIGAGTILISATSCSPSNASPAVGATKAATRSVAATPTPTIPPQALVVYRGHSGPVFSVSWSPDSTRIASGSGFDKTVQVWEAASGSHLYTYNDTPHPIWSVAWSRDGAHIGIGAATPRPYGGLDNALASGPLQILDASSGNMLHSYEGHFVYAVAWSPDSTRIASAGADEFVRVWDYATGQTTLIYKGHFTANYHGHYGTDNIYALAWSPDGTKIASGAEDKTVQVWNALTGETYYIYTHHTNMVDGLSWSPNGKYIASGSYDGTAQVWEAADGHLIYTYRGHNGIVTSVAWSPDGKLLASGSQDKTVQVWNAPGSSS